MTTLPTPPTAGQRPHSYEHHGTRIDDPWHWLRDQGYPKVEDPEILAYLKAENDYFEAAMAPHRPLIDSLFEEMKGRIKEDDRSVPVRDGDWLYWWAFDTGAQYRKWYRQPAGGGEEQLIFDEPAEAEGKDYFRLGAIEISPDGRLAATLIDDDGSERFKLRIRDLATGADVEQVSDVGIGSPVWTADGEGLVFTEVNEQWRSYRARLHRLGTPAAEDVTLYQEEEDVGFSVGVGRSHDRSLIFIATGDNSSTEVRFVPAADAAAPLTLVAKRRPEIIYSVDAAHGRLWVLANDEHINFRLAEADPATPGDWRTVIAGTDAVYIRGVTPFRDHLVLQERLHGLDQIRLRAYDGEERRIAFPEASYTAALGSNPEFAPTAYRLGYSSMVTPGTVYDYHSGEDRLETLKVQEVPSGYDPADYATERLMLPTRDGKLVPASIVYRKGFAKDGCGKLYLYAYGA